jgi:hypothetical protein
VSKKHLEKFFDEGYIFIRFAWNSNDLDICFKNCSCSKEDKLNEIYSLFELIENNKM